MKRFIYNWTLARQEENYKDGGKFISNNDIRKEITLFKITDDYKWLNKVSNNIAEQIPMNVKYTNPRISFDRKYWYLSVGIEKKIQQ